MDCDPIASLTWAIFLFDSALVIGFLWWLVACYMERRGWKLRALAAERECVTLRGKLADVIDAAGQASATDGGWLAKLLVRWGA